MSQVNNPLVASGITTGVNRTYPCLQILQLFSRFMTIQVKFGGNLADQLKLTVRCQANYVAINSGLFLCIKM